MAAADDLVVKVRAEFEPPIEEVRRLSIKPGEVLVVKLDGRCTHAIADDIRAQLATVFPDNRALVMASDVDLSVVSPEVVHLCPPEGSGAMPCCGRAPFDVPTRDRMTVHDDQVTCSRGGIGGIVPSQLYMVGESGPEQLRRVGGEHPGEIGTTLD